MTEDRDTRCQAADMLLDIGIRIPVMPLRPFKKRPGKSFLVMRRPPAGAVIRIARRYLELGVTPEEIRAMNYEERMRFVAERERRSAGWSHWPYAPDGSRGCCSPALWHGTSDGGCIRRCSPPPSSNCSGAWTYSLFAILFHWRPGQRGCWSR